LENSTQAGDSSSERASGTESLISAVIWPSAYLNQLPADQSALDHLGRPIPIEPRNDFQFQSHAIRSGWLFDPVSVPNLRLTVQDTNQVAVGGALIQLQ
jgi:hypothetical protein